MRSALSVSFHDRVSWRLCEVILFLGISNTPSSGGGNDDAELGGAENPVRVGTVSAGESYWELLVDAAEEGGGHSR